jgi:hypothetical protein
MFYVRHGMVGVQPLTDATVLNQIRVCARLLDYWLYQASGFNPGPIPSSPQSLEQLLRMLREVDFESAPVRSPSVGIRESVLSAEFPGAEELSRTL